MELKINNLNLSETFPALGETERLSNGKRIDQIRATVNEELGRFSLEGQYHPGMAAFVEEAHRLLMSPEAKRVRSVIPVLLAEERGTSPGTGLLYGVVIELLHFVSLVHDDVIDRHDSRRGYQTLHRTFTNSQAVLTGDYLMYEVIRHCLSFDYGPRVIELVVNAAKDMVAGVVMEQSVLESEPTLDNYIEMARRKTGSLFALSFGLPFVAEKGLEKALECGVLFGVVFQIYDDHQDRHRDSVHENIFRMCTPEEVEKTATDHIDLLFDSCRELGIENTLIQVVDFLRGFGYFT